MPTLLDMAGVGIPETVEGLSMLGKERRSYLYGECVEDAGATRMIHDGRYKLVYYAVGNHVQLFDLKEDPHELHDLAGSKEHQQLQGRLTALLIDEMYGVDREWIKGGKLVGLPDRPFAPAPRRGLAGQRGIHWPQPPTHDSSTPVGIPT